MRTYPSKRSAVKMLRMEVILKHTRNKAMSFHQIGELVGVKYATARAYVMELKKDYPFYIAGYERTKGDFTPLYKQGSKKDMPRPERIPHWVYDMKRSPRPSRRRSKDYETNSKPRRDVAASWF